jgi:hypothetical protein
MVIDDTPSPAHTTPNQWQSSPPMADHAGMDQFGLCHGRVLTLPYKIAADDTWVQLATRKFIVAQGWVPTTDPFSFTAGDYLCTEHEWLSCIVFWLIYAAQTQQACH